MKKFFSFSIFFLLLAPASLALAVDISLANYALPGQQTENFVLYLDTQEERVNTVAGQLKFNPNKIKVVSLVEQNSPFVLTLEKKIDNKLGVINFSSVAPGGFSGRAEVVVVNFTKLSNELSFNPSLTIEQIEVLRNDGLGTSLPVRLVEASVGEFADFQQLTNSEQDKIAPEFFVPLVARDDGLLGGGRYLFFQTIDKGSGVQGYYRAKSLRYLNLKEQDSRVINKLNWQEVESPLAISSLPSLRFHYLKVVDLSGNALVVEVKELRPIYISWWFWVIIIVSALGVWFWRKKTKK